MTILKAVNFKSSKARIVAPYPLTRTLSVKHTDAGKSLLHYLSEKFPFITSKEWKRRIELGWVWLDNRDTHSDKTLKAGQLIFHHNPKVKEPAVPDSVRIINETEDWLIAFKPAPMPMHQGGRYFKNTLSYILNEMGHRNLNITHRLDSVTSGLVLFAKNKNTAQKFQEAFSNGKITRWYYAIVSGKPASEKLLVDAPIQRKKGFVFECSPNGKPAKTRIENVRTLGENSLVKCFPITGRTHQIRLHLKHAGIPIIDDPIYGLKGDVSGTRLQNTAIKLQSSGLIVDDFSIHEELDELLWGEE